MEIDPSTLTYNDRFPAHPREQKASGSTISFLLRPQNTIHAGQIASHLDLFNKVLTCTAPADQEPADIHSNRKDIIYVSRFWYQIMLIIRHKPVIIFKRPNL